MFAFRSAIRRLFGIFIPGVDSSEADVIAELRSALDEAEAEIVQLRDAAFIEKLFAAISKAQLISALGDAMNAYDIKGIEVSEEDEDEDFPNDVVDSY